MQNLVFGGETDIKQGPTTLITVATAEERDMMGGGAGKPAFTLSEVFKFL